MTDDITAMNNAANGVLNAKIEGLGTTGDGVFYHDGKTYFLPNTLPGETVSFRFTGDTPELIDIIETSNSRVTPPCTLFDECGGCSVQHMTLPALLEWKADRITRLLDSVFVNPPTPAQYQTPPRTRRRMDLAIQRVTGGVHIGLHARAGEPINMTACDVLVPELFELLTPLRDVLSGIGAITGRADLQINLLDTGPDLTLSTPAPLTTADRTKLAAFARKHTIRRIAWTPLGKREIETVAQSRAPYIRFGSAEVTPPPAAFLQASKESEKAIQDAVLAGLPALNKKDIIVELYAGCGTLTLPMSDKGRVIAYEGDAEAAASLRTASGGRRIDAHMRDLVRQPLLPHDLKTARVVVLDPPYTGAGPQIEPLARSAVRDIIYVSCNPVALKKDLQTLHKAGFELISSTVVDQFLWSTEIETVVVLSRDPKRIKRENSRRNRSAPSHSDS
nr:class I SAM-dependent RNA methyltransferase [uncultured Neokomagataea sp.]